MRERIERGLPTPVEMDDCEKSVVEAEADFIGIKLKKVMKKKNMALKSPLRVLPMLSSKKIKLLRLNFSRRSED